MSIQTINEVWKLLKPIFESETTTQDAAEIVVNYLVEHDYSIKEITETFKGDTSLREALAFYLEKPEDLNSLVSHEDEDDDDYDDNPFDDDYYDDVDDY